MSEELPEFDLDSYLPYRLTVAAQALSKELENKYKNRFEMSVPEWRVLVNVGYSGFGSVRDIEKRVSLGKSKVSRAASRLEARGLILKQVDPSDRRLIMLELTEEGRRVLSDVVPIAKGFQDELLKALGSNADSLHLALDALMGENS